MARFWRYAVGGLLLLAGTGCGGGPPPPASGTLDPADVDGDRAFALVEGLIGFSPREPGTEGGRRAAEWIADRFREVGLDPEIDVFTDPTPDGPLEFRNVIARRPGRTREILLLGTHFDTKTGIGPNFVGANDSGSSTGLVLELARVIMASDLAGPEIWFVAFDGEEARVRYGPNDGLHGSRRLARQLVESGRADDVRAVIVLDMVGDRNLNVSIPANTTPELRQLALEAAAARGHRRFFGLTRGHILDDHAPFLERGMPAVLLIDFEYGSRPGLNDYWHTEEDTLDKLSPESLRIVGEVTLDMLRRLTGVEP